MSLPTPVECPHVLPISLPPPHSTRRTSLPSHSPYNAQYHTRRAGLGTDGATPATACIRLHPSALPPPPPPRRGTRGTRHVMHYAPLSARGRECTARTSYHCRRAAIAHPLLGAENAAVPPKGKQQALRVAQVRAGPPTAPRALRNEHGARARARPAPG